jgi:hypothetical protein
VNQERQSTRFGRPNRSRQRHVHDHSITAVGTTETVSGFYAILGGASSAFLSALLTAMLLLVNGSLTLILIESLVDAGPDWIYRKGLMQFALFTFPLFMVVAEWIIWDFGRRLLSREKSAQDRCNST